MTIRSSPCKMYGLLVLIVLSAWGQTAQITGTVTDATAASVANAVVTATNIQTGVSRSSTSNEAGNYLITSLFPGQYVVSASAQGFKQIRRPAVTLVVEQIARLDFHMEVGETKESIT